MSAFLNNLQQPEYVHVLLNHLPLTGLFAAVLSLVGGLVLRQRAVLFLGLVLVSLFALSAWPVSEFGEQGYDRVLAMSDDDGRAWLDRHRDLAGKWVFLFYVAAGAGAVALVAGWKWPRALWPASLGVALLCAGSLVAGGAIAECGGQVRHREFRRQPPPAAAGKNPQARGGERSATTSWSGILTMGIPAGDWWGRVPPRPHLLPRFRNGDAGGTRPYRFRVRIAAIWFAAGTLGPRPVNPEWPSTFRKR